MSIRHSIVKRPTFSELVSVQRPDGTQLRVLDHISVLKHAQLLHFGYKLLNDRLRVQKIARDTRDDDEMLLHELFKFWLAKDDSNRRDPAFPRTWRALAYCLEETTEEMGVLVHDLREHFD